MMHRPTPAILLICLCLFMPLSAQADPPKLSRATGAISAARDVAPAADEAEAVDVIDVTGFMEWPRGDSRVGWQRPARFQRNTDLVFGLSLKNEVLRPVDRDGLRRAMRVQRLLSQGEGS